MAKEEKQSLYDKMSSALGELQNYEASLEKAKEAFNISNAAVMAANRKSPEAAKSLQDSDNTRHQVNFLEAGLNDSQKTFEKDFVKNRGNLEALLTDKNVAKTLPAAVFNYEPSVPKEGKYAEAGKLHKQLIPMMTRYQAFRGQQLSKNQDDSLFADMSTDIISDYAKSEKDPLYLRALVELAGGAVEKGKDGKVQVVKDKEGKPVVASNNVANKQFVAMRYEGMIEEKRKKFFELVGKDLPGYISQTLPDKYEKARGFYEAVTGIVESEKQKASVKGSSKGSPSSSYAMAA